MWAPVRRALPAGNAIVAPLALVIKVRPGIEEIEGGLVRGQPHFDLVAGGGELGGLADAAPFDGGSRRAPAQIAEERSGEESDRT